MAENDPRDVRPQFFEERGVPESVDLPDEILGVYTTSRESSASSEGRTYARRAVLTSEGWVPPAPETVVHVVAQAGDGPNDLEALREYTVGKATRIATDPRELRAELGPESTIIADDDVSPAVLSNYRDELSFYIPDGLDVDEEADYIRDCVYPAVRYYLEENDGKRPTLVELVDVLVNWYGVSEAGAEKAVRLEVEDLQDEP